MFRNDFIPNDLAQNGGIKVLMPVISRRSWEIFHETQDRSRTFWLPQPSQHSHSSHAGEVRSRQNDSQVGDTAPDFISQRSVEDRQLSDYRGKKNVFLAVYVLAFTGG